MAWYTNSKTGGKFWVDDDEDIRSRQIMAQQVKAKQLNDEEELTDLYKKMDNAYINYKTAVKMHTQSKFHTKEQNAENKRIVAEAKAEWEAAKKAYQTRKGN